MLFNKVIRNLIGMNIRIRQSTLFFAMLISLMGCAGTDTPESKQSIETRQKQLTAKVNNLEKEMAEWQQMKPSVARLVVIESDLKELIVQLGAMVEEPELATESASESMPTSAPESTLVSEPEIKTALASEIEIEPAVEKPVSPAVQDMPVLEQVQAPVVSQPVLKQPKEQQTASAYPSGPEQPIEVSHASTNGFLASDHSGGKYALQLSSVTNPWVIEPFWLKLQKKYASALEGVTPTYERASVKGETYFRIKVGQFSKRTQAKQACAQLKEIGGSCVVTLNNGVIYQELDIRDL